MPGIFLGVKFQARVFFWVRNMKLRRTPPSCIRQVPPPLGLWPGPVMKPKVFRRTYSINTHTRLDGVLLPLSGFLGTSLPLP